MTTIATVTRAQLETLRDEAGSAADGERVAVCNKALDGDRPAIAECVRAMQEAEAQCPFQKGDAVVIVGREGRFPGTVVEEAEYGSRVIAKADDFSKRIGFLPGEDGVWRNFTKWSLEKA